VRSVLRITARHEMGGCRDARFATRIKARALDRCGELLRQIPASSGGRPETKDAADLSLSPRQQAAHNADLSERQRKTALRINSIPRERFEALVESANPPTATQLAEIGKKKRQRPLRDLGDRSPEEFAAATALTEIIEDFVRASAGVDILLVLRRCEKVGLERLLASARSASEWLKDLLGEDNAPGELVGRRAERISGAKVAGRRGIEDVFHGIEPECASKPNALKQAWITASEPERIVSVGALAKLPAGKQRSVADTARRDEQVSAVIAFSACDPEASKTSDGTGKEAEPAPTLDARAWSMSTAQQRQVFVKAVGRSEIEDVFHEIEPGYASMRGLNTLNQSWIAATESDRLTFYRQHFPANAWNRFQT
jgi:hypothetical protein